MKPTLVGKIQILSGIELPDIRRKVAAMEETKKQLNDYRHPMFGEVHHLTSRKPFIKTSEPITEAATENRLKKVEGT